MTDRSPAPTGRATSTISACKFCDHEAIRFVEVAIGERAAREVHVLPIDAEPHADGRVIEVVEKPGTFKLLRKSAVVPPAVPAYRLHGASNCGSRR